MSKRSDHPHATPVAEAHPPGRILVVDDQPSNIQVVGGALGRLGHEIIPASDGPTALRRLAARRPDLILLDMFMPGMDGCEVCRRLQANPEWRDIPVIFLSAADDKEHIVRALESGGVDYVTKPFHHPELVSRVRTQLALKAARDRLRDLAEDKDELLGILAHDLKNHLGGMHMSAKLLHEQVVRRNPPEPRVEQLAANIAFTSGNLLTFVKEFLANAATDHGISIHLAPVDVAGAVAVAMARYREPAQRKDLTLEACLPESPAMALADASALDQVLENLLSNAVKFSPAGKKVTVTVESTAGHVECRVRDEGPGFSDDDRAQMYRRYTRLSARPTAGEPSTGLGLSIVKKLVLGMNGTLTCGSVPQEGATFTVRLPASPAS